LQVLGGGGLLTTNIGAEVFEDLEIVPIA